MNLSICTVQEFFLSVSGEVRRRRRTAVNPTVLYDDQKSIVNNSEQLTMTAFFFP